ncbi:hypothetical protein ADUPG1_013245 [Aduncisulcus paluster]|uniref:Uncharacterized protein n=1 Tax=Aduncisulcus paluster TaxID=2918883 RepID=A0ABQ5K2A6_9EUKA|nr:hypothetical protein ADUPG1_013245 [Aduncisulcus paluster]
MCIFFASIPLACIYGLFIPLILYAIPMAWDYLSATEDNPTWIPWEYAIVRRIFWFSAISSVGGIVGIAYATKYRKDNDLDDPKAGCCVKFSSVPGSFAGVTLLLQCQGVYILFSLFDDFYADYVKYLWWAIIGLSIISVLKAIGCGVSSHNYQIEKLKKPAATEMQAPVRSVNEVFVQPQVGGYELRGTNFV